MLLRHAAWVPILLLTLVVLTHSACSPVPSGFVFMPTVNHVADDIFCSRNSDDGTSLTVAGQAAACLANAPQCVGFTMEPTGSCLKTSNQPLMRAYPYVSCYGFYKLSDPSLPYPPLRPPQPGRALPPAPNDTTPAPNGTCRDMPGFRFVKNVLPISGLLGGIAAGTLQDAANGCNLVGECDGFDTRSLLGANMTVAPVNASAAPGVCQGTYFIVRAPNFISAFAPCDAVPSNYTFVPGMALSTAAAAAANLSCSKGQSGETWTIASQAANCTADARCLAFSAGLTASCLLNVSGPLRPAWGNVSCFGTYVKHGLNSPSLPPSPPPLPPTPPFPVSNVSCVELEGYRYIPGINIVAATYFGGVLPGGLLPAKAACDAAPSCDGFDSSTRLGNSFTTAPRRAPVATPGEAPLSPCLGVYIRFDALYKYGQLSAVPPAHPYSPFRHSAPPPPGALNRPPPLMYGAPNQPGSYIAAGGTFPVWAIVVIAVGAFALVALIGVIVVVIIVRRRRQQQLPPAAAATAAKKQMLSYSLYGNPSSSINVQLEGKPTSSSSTTMGVASKLLSSFLPYSSPPRSYDSAEASPGRLTAATAARDTGSDGSLVPHSNLPNASYDSFDLPKDSGSMMMDLVIVKGRPTAEEKVLDPELMKLQINRQHSRLKDEQLVLFEMIGQGGSGVVYRAEWKGLPVAAKTMVLHDESREKAHRQMMEATMSTGLCHPNIVNTYACDIKSIKEPGDALLPPHRADPFAKWQMVILQELCTGGSLKQLISSGALTLRGSGGDMLSTKLVHVLQLAVDVATGLEHLHSKNIVHSDLTPNNVLLQEAGRVARPLGLQWVAKLADFGLSIVFEEGRSQVSRVFAGTPHYIAPETQAEGNISKQSDIFTFGILMYELAAGGTDVRHWSTTQDVLPLLQLAQDRPSNEASDDASGGSSSSSGSSGGKAPGGTPGDFSSGGPAGDGSEVAAVSVDLDIVVIAPSGFVGGLPGSAEGAEGRGDREAADGGRGGSSSSGGGGSAATFGGPRSQAALALQELAGGTCAGGTAADEACADAAAAAQPCVPVNSSSAGAEGAVGVSGEGADLIASSTDPSASSVAQTILKKKAVTRTVSHLEPLLGGCRGHRGPAWVLPPLPAACPPAFRALVRHCLSQAPEARPTVVQVRQRLTALLDTHTHRCA